MAWIFLIKGAALTASADNPYPIADDLETSDAFKAIVDEAREAGLVVRAEPDIDGQALSVLVGRELHEDRHIRKGQTVCVSDDLPDADAALIDSLADRLMSAMKDAGVSDPKLARGIVLSQFD